MIGRDIYSSPEGEDDEWVDGEEGNGNPARGDEEKTGNVLGRGIDVAAGTVAGVGILAGGEAITSSVSDGTNIGTASEDGLETDTMMSMFERFD